MRGYSAYVPQYFSATTVVAPTMRFKNLLCWRCWNAGSLAARVVALCSGRNAGEHGADHPPVRQGGCGASGKGVCGGREAQIMGVAV